MCANTYHLTLESAHDHLWGTGVALSDPDCLNTTKWTSQGILGELLEEIRDEYYNANPTTTKNSQPEGHTYSPSMTLPASQLTPTITTTHPIPVLNTNDTENRKDLSELTSDPQSDKPIPSLFGADKTFPNESNLRNVTSSVSSMEISEPTSEPTSDTTADSVRSDPSENDGRNISTGTFITTPLITDASKVKDPDEQNEGTILLDASSM